MGWVCIGYLALLDDAVVGVLGSVGARGLCRKILEEDEVTIREARDHGAQRTHIDRLLDMMDLKTKGGASNVPGRKLDLKNDKEVE